MEIMTSTWVVIPIHIGMEVSMLLRCQLSADFVEIPALCWWFPALCWCCWDASFVLKISSLVLMSMMLQPSCCDVDVVDVVSALCCYWWWWWWCISVILIHVDANDDDAIPSLSCEWWYWWCEKLLMIYRYANQCSRCCCCCYPLSLLMMLYWAVSI